MQWQQSSHEHFLKVAPSYDLGRTFERGRFWAEEIQRVTPIDPVDTLVDVGCGTGLFTAAFAAYHPCKFIGIDPSPLMLQAAKEKHGQDQIVWIEGEAEHLPIPSESAKCIFVSQVWHHIQDKTLAAREFFRILKPGGVVLIKTYSQEQIRSRWDLQVVFPELMPFMLEIYDDIPFFNNLFKTAGFRQVDHKDFREYETMKPSVLQEIAEQRLWSMFSYISEEGRQSGIQYLQKRMDETGDAPVRYDEIHHLVIGKKG
jgi:ubiquinone/menaquinone biosynthesis C-methylase UbiE